MSTLLLFSMIFCHIVDDYYLQGCLAKLKQKNWWNDNYNQIMYKNDYIAALIAHAFSWSFVMMLPMTIYMVATNQIQSGYFIVMIANVLQHAFVDNEKCNKLTINLCVDQFIHMLQIIGTWCICCCNFNIW